MILAAPAASWTWPADGQVIRAFSLGDDPYAAGQHRGVDIAGDTGSSARAPAAGTVSFAGTVPGNGRTVTIKSADGYAVTLVGLGSIGVAKNALVNEGDTVGTIAPAPGDGTPANVHLGIRVASDPDGYVDPLGLLPARTEQPAATDTASDETAPAATDESTPATSDGAAGSGDGAVSTAPEEGTPAAGDEASGSDDPAAEIDDAEPGSELEVGTAIGAVAEAAPSAADPSTGTGDAQTPTSAAAPEGASDQAGAATTAEQVPVSESATPAEPQAATGADAGVEVSSQADQPSPAPAGKSSSGARAAAANEARTVQGGSGEPGTAAAAHTSRPQHRVVVAPGGSKAASSGARAKLATHSRWFDSRWILLPALLALLLAATGGSVLVAGRIRGSRRPPRMMLSPDGDAADDERERESEEDPGRGGLAVCQWPAPHWARRRVRRPVRHLRPLSPTQRQRRVDGEWHRRTRDARHGRGRARRALVS
jgi:hypothetical protein